MESPYILILGCFDTKGEVFKYLRDQILQLGERVVTMNTGTMGSTSAFPVDIEAEAVAKAAGTTLEKIRKANDRGEAVAKMGAGAAGIIGQLVAGGHLKAAISMGGGGGTFIALSAMQGIPLGIPKLCITTLAAKDLSRPMGYKDITLMPSVVDVAGLNSIIQPIIGQAAAAICAMANLQSSEKTTHRGSIAISMFGNTTACVNQCTGLLEKAGYEVMAFHANGVGGSTMEALIREGVFAGVLDVTTTELADELCRGVCSAGPARLTAAAEADVPQVVVPGCLDMVNYAEPDTVPPKYHDRQLYSWAPNVTLMRTDVAENRVLGKEIGSKLEGANASIVLPLKGLSQIDAEGDIFHNPEVNRALFNSIKENAEPGLEVIEADYHINDQAFSEILVKKLLEKIHSTQALER
ncbi:Tm-1-like ATP-binding domain-containing protein [Persicitalea jodogahamensis]|uniref:Uncharacterized protein n=1 Tax=Persicitalea jodogahamensis TaxID=402147 RepID=A0A8J3G8M3_9BACT|nr:Tm-1-like ATP-binding domain-containing protein [Persicitalea jodogahamensis]GHB65830.1 hypothetical protein GCM10007390_19930 [Persicitalea jodogahamensis]